MDGLSEDSTLLSVILIADFIDRLVERWLYFLTVASIAWLYYSLTGKPDVWLTLGFLAWKHSAVTVISRYIGLNRLSLITIIAAATCFFGYSILQWLVLGTSSGRTGDPRPMLIPSRITHSRLFPKQHSFSYPYLTIGVPVDSTGNVNGMISVDTSSSSTWLPGLLRPKVWFSIDAGDHFQRQSSPTGLRGKLDSYLESEHVDPSQYHHAYLVTSPRLLGFGYSPVSFWFLYSQDKVLSAIIVEMHSIFGERHSYLAVRNFEAEAKHIQDGNLDNQELIRAQVKATVQKEFHVSPFNSRNGSYTLLASNPLGSDMCGFRGLDITLHLFSSKDHPKLVAKLVSDNQAIDSRMMNIVQKAGFILTWFWSAVATLPRFIKESAVLFYRHNLHFWYRPEPRKNSIGRSSSDVEKILERIFRAYLRSLVEQSSAPVAVRYTPSGDAEVSEEVLRSPSATDSSESADEITIKILTPAFYSRFVHYAHDSEAVFCELAESCTFWTDKPEQLTMIFLKKGSPSLHASSLVEYVWFQLIKTMRRRPRKIERPLTSVDKSLSSTTGIDIRGFRISSMDAFVLGQEDARVKKAYRMAVLRLFVADRITLGSTTLLGMMELLGRAGISWALASLIAHGIS
ncbi:hypothetical protein FPOAC2_03372 [Fusarium poae]|jgi:DUF1365 family protein|uniref:DUF1365 domain-containing protein n=2 Tax=Fusarium poae TaxID=36050 RepID=A0A1B8B8W3_FUSPO|nr:hypothetical protein FPOA_03103 [Fusarium poae]